MNEEEKSYDRQYLPVESAAHYLGVTQRSLRDLEARGIVPGCRLGRSLRFDLNALDDHLRECRIQTLEEIKSGVQQVPLGYLGPLIPPEAAAAYLGLSSARALTQRVYRMQIPAYRISERIIRFRKCELDTCMLTSTDTFPNLEDSACLPNLGGR